MIVKFKDPDLEISMAKSANEIIPNYSIHPSEILIEELKERKIKPKDFAQTLNMNFTEFNQFLHGKRNVTPELAQKLEQTLGIKARFWLNLHERYLLTLQINSERKQKEKNRKNNVRQVLQEAIDRYGYTNAEVARLTAIDEKKIEDFLNGKAVPNLKMAGVLCTVLSIAPSAMLGL